MPQRLSAIFLIALLTAPFALVFVMLTLEKYAVRSEVKKEILLGMSDDQLERIVIEQDEVESLDWEHEKEFKYRGEMYDIVRSETFANHTVYWCWADHDETVLHEKIDRLLAGTLSKDIPQESHHTNSLEFFKMGRQNQEYFNHSVLLLSKHLKRIDHFPMNLVHFSICPPTPPPQAVT